MKKETRRSKLPFHDETVDSRKNSCVDVKKKKKERGIPTAIEVQQYLLYKNFMGY